MEPINHNCLKKGKERAANEKIEYEKSSEIIGACEEKISWKNRRSPEMFRTPSLVYDVCYEVENYFTGNLFRIHPMQLREVLMNKPL